MAIPMLISELDFDLPSELIAQQGADRRDASRMLTVDRRSGTFDDRVFSELPQLLKKDDLLVLNNTKVFPARLFGQSETGAGVEVFLVNELSNGTWETLARPARRLRPGKLIVFDENLAGEVVGKNADGRVFVRFESKGDFYENLDRIGKTPLPPYIKRGSAAIDSDRERYQTVFAKDRGAIAAPTAGLHFTQETLEILKAKGVEIVEITLHVGYGTFEPIRVDDLGQHKVSPERYAIGNEAAISLSNAKNSGRRIVAVGTTSTRALESNIAAFGRFTPGSHAADLTIKPGFEFRAIDSLLTNFHLPQSSLLLLTSVFGGRDLIISAYRHAVAERYRFYSYGDCMFIS